MPPGGKAPDSPPYLLQAGFLPVNSPQVVARPGLFSAPSAGSRQWAGGQRRAERTGARELSVAGLLGHVSELSETRSCVAGKEQVPPGEQ